MEEKMWFLRTFCPQSLRFLMELRVLMEILLPCRETTVLKLYCLIVGVPTSERCIRYILFEGLGEETTDG